MSDAVERKRWTFEATYEIEATRRQAYVEFRVVRIVDGRLFQAPSDDNWATTDKFEEACTYLHGDVKFDGCSNWHFDEQDDAMLHFCDDVALEQIGKLLAEMWDAAKEMLGSAWQGPETVKRGLQKRA